MSTELTLKSDSRLEFAYGRVLPGREKWMAEEYFGTVGPKLVEHGFERLHVMPDSELDARYRFSATKPKHVHISNPQAEGYLGHTPGWMIHHGSIAYGPFDFENDPPFKRNAYIEYSSWTTVHDPNERYAGGKYAMQSDGSDTLAEWVKEDEPLMGQDIVSWFTAGFHHIPRMEDWPVMSTEWKTVHIMPFNFFSHNPALTIRE